MSHKLPCCVVRDLLPLYLDGLTEQETNDALSAHLAECSECRSHLHAMKNTDTPIEEENKKEVDFLKGVRRQNHRKILFAVLGTAAALLAVFCVKIFVIGSAVPEGRMDASPALMDSNGDGIADDALKITFFNPNSAKAYRGWDYHFDNGVLEISAHEVLAAFGRGSTERIVSLDGLHEVRAFGVTLWQDGVLIRPDTAQMYSKKTPYVGSMSNLARLDATLALPEAKYTNELFTSAEPYGRALYFDRTLSSVEQRMMRRAGALMIALVDNLSYVEWTWPQPDGTQGKACIRADDFNALLPEMLAAHTQNPALSYKSIKEFGASPAALQQLCALLREPVFEGE